MPMQRPLRASGPLLALALAHSGCAPAPLASAPAERASCYDPARVGPLLELRGEGPLVAVVAPRLGGQLVGLSYRDRETPIELLYRGMDFCERPGWGGKAPILWPATGRNFEERAPRGMGWTWEGQVLSMPIHGFARDLPWPVVGERKDAPASDLQLELTQTRETLSHYPFGFNIRVAYRLDREDLEIAYTVRASPDNRLDMPFSIGNHITFRQSLSGQGAMRLTTPAGRRLNLDSAGKPVGAEAISPYTNHALTEFADEKAVPLAGYPSEPWLQLDDPGGLSIRLSHRSSHLTEGEAVMFNLWGSSALGFFSPEPWLGRQNSLADNTGVVRLAPGESFEWILKITILPNRGSSSFAPAAPRVRGSSARDHGDAPR